MKRTRFYILTLALLLVFGSPGIARANCTNPTDVERKIIYNTTYHLYQFCNGTNWIAWGPVGGVGGGGGTLHTLQISDGAVHQYRFDETSGTTATDRGSSPSNGTYSGAGVALNQTPAISSDLSGDPLLSGGAGDVGLAFTDPPAAAGDGSFSIEFVFKPVSTGGNPRIMANDHTDSDGHGFQILGGGVSPAAVVQMGFTGGTAQVSPDYSFVGGQVYLMDVVYDGTAHTLSVYVNASFYSSVSTSGTYQNGTTNIGVGYNPAYGSDYDNAYIANAAFYKFALTSTQITDHHNAM
jgi:hypothetical protein